MELNVDIWPVQFVRVNIEGLKLTRPVFALLFWHGYTMRRCVTHGISCVARHSFDLHTLYMTIMPMDKNIMNINAVNNQHLIFLSCNSEPAARLSASDISDRNQFQS